MTTGWVGVARNVESGALRGRRKTEREDGALCSSVGTVGDDNSGAPRRRRFRSEAEEKAKPLGGHERNDATGEVV